MSLLDKINSIPLFRPLGISQSLRNVCIIAFDDCLSKLEPLLTEHPWLNCAHLIIPNMDKNHTSRLRIEINGSLIPCSPLDNLGFLPELEKIYICPDNPVAMTSSLNMLAIFGANFHVRTFYLYSDKAPIYSIRNPLPDFFSKNEERLESAMQLFADEQSRDTFAARIKALITGNAAFMPIAPFEEYFHPLVQPMPGDWMIDGGVSDMVLSQKKFLAATGPEGHIFGFEPIPYMAQKAQKTLKSFPGYHLQTLGLADKPGEAYFQDLRDSSHMVNNGENGSIRCDLTSIDAFVKEWHLKPVDCIKLDVEGAELKALMGAEATIKKTHPRLIICLYHKPQDMFEIPEYIKKIAPGYNLYLAHSSCQFTDTILYGLYAQ